MSKETLQELVRAALDHADDCRTKAFVIPIPNTTPALFVALGERDEIAALLRASIRSGA